jgi:hypothetical protein
MPTFRHRRVTTYIYETDGRCSMIVSMIDELRLALRSLIKAPGYVTAAVVTIAVAMAVNGAIFGAVYAVLVKPFRFEQRHVLSLAGNQSFAYPELRVGEPWVFHDER